MASAEHALVPSPLHAGLVELFRNRPELAPALLGELLGVALPDYGEARIAAADVAVLAPADYHADLVVVLSDGEARLAIIVEVQLARVERKRFTWPIYVAGLRARLKCDVCLLVVTPSEPVAEWAKQAIRLGPGGVLVPFAVGPRALPSVIDDAQAARMPELVILAAIGHGHDEDEAAATALMVSALAVCDRVAASRDDLAVLYLDMIEAALGGAVRKAFKELMAIPNYEWQGDFAKKHRGEGRAEGRAEGLAEGLAKGVAEGLADAVIHVLKARALPLSAADAARIVACKDIAVLERWVERAVTTASVDDLFVD